MFNLENLTRGSKNIKADSYKRRIEHLAYKGYETQHIESAVEAATANLQNKKIHS